jgi:hypothetical protein
VTIVAVFYSAVPSEKPEQLAAKEN